MRQTFSFAITKEFQSSLFFSLLFWLVRVNGGRVKNPSNQHWTWAHTRCGATFQAPQQPPQCLETQSRQSCVSRGRVALCKWKKVSVNLTVCAPGGSCWLLWWGSCLLWQMGITFPYEYSEMCSLSERAVLTPSGAPTDIFIVLHITKMVQTVSSFISVWSKDLCYLAGTPGTWWMKGMESSTSWFCAGAKAMAGEPLQQHHCQHYIGVWIWSHFLFVQSSPRLRHRLKPMTPPTAPFPAYSSHRRSLIPVWFSGNHYVKITRSRVWGSHGWEWTSLQAQWVFCGTSRLKPLKKTKPSPPFGLARRNVALLLVAGSRKWTTNCLSCVWICSSIHDHSDSHCFLKMLQGQLKETLFDWPEKKSHGDMVQKSQQVLQENKVAYINGEEQEPWLPPPHRLLPLI